MSLSYSAQTKRDGHTDGRTYRRTGVFQYLPSQAFGAAGATNIYVAIGLFICLYMWALVTRVGRTVVGPQ